MLKEKHERLLLLALSKVKWYARCLNLCDYLPQVFQNLPLAPLKKC